MITRLIHASGNVRLELIRAIATYTSAAMFAYLFRIFWPLTPQAVIGALSETGSRFGQFWRNRLS